MLINFISHFKVGLKASLNVSKSTFCSFFFLISTIKLVAQNEVHCLCGTDPTPAGVMGSHLHMKGEWMFSYRFMNMQMSGIQNEKSSITASEVLVDYLTAPSTMKMNMHMLMAMYGVSDKLTLMGMIDYLQNDMVMKMLEVDESLHAGMHMGTLGNEMQMKSNGVGDIKISALYGLFSKESSQLIFSAGLNFPTGTIQFSGDQFDMMYKNKIYPYGMQLGSGTFDFLLGLIYLIEKGSNTFSTQLNSTIRPFYNKLDYNLGNSTLLNVWYARNWKEWGSSSVRFNYQYKDKIRGSYSGIYRFSEPAANTENYGSNTIKFFTGTSFFIKQKHRLSVELGLPLAQKFNGIQMKMNSDLILSYNIKL